MISRQPGSSYQLGRHRSAFVTVIAQPSPAGTRVPIPGSGVGVGVGFAVGAGVVVGLMVGLAVAGATIAGRSVGYGAVVPAGT